MTRHLVSQFRNQECQNCYFTYTRQPKPIAYGDIVDWSFINANRDLQIQWWIDEQGWEKFLKINAKAYTDLVYVFYANLVKHENEDDGTIWYNMVINGKRIALDANDFLEHLGFADQAWNL